MLKLTSELINAAADWWASQWIPDDTRSSFREALVATLSEEKLVSEQGCLIRGGEELLLDVDYDPHDLLLIAVNAVTLCRGFLFSANGILPTKTRMWIQRDRIAVSCGRGAPRVVIFGEHQGAGG